jgi:hypothetical protein
MDATKSELELLVQRIVGVLQRHASADCLSDQEALHALHVILLKSKCGRVLKELDAPRKRRLQPIPREVVHRFRYE